MKNSWNFEDTFFGQGCITNLDARLKQIDASRIFVIHGNSYEKLHGKELIDSLLARYDVYRHTDFSVNPEYSDIVKGAKLVDDFGPDAILAIGGGSAIDTGKLLSVLTAGDGLIAGTIRTGKVNTVRKIPLFAVPTTAGSGSEATHFAVVYMDGTKYSVASPLLLPNCCFVDAAFTWSMPPALTAVTGLDALSHAVESYWAVCSTAQSREYAAQAIRLVLHSFKSAVEKPCAQAREWMTTAAFLAGKAINITKTTAAHACSYYLTVRFGLPHGQAVGILLPYFVLYNSCNDTVAGYSAIVHQQRMQELCRLFGVKSAGAIARKITGMLNIGGLNIAVGSLLNTTAEINSFFASINMERLANNPAAVNSCALKSFMRLN